jgi:hypothetical protein
MSDRPQAVDVAARLLGLLVFLVGIGLILWVFRQAELLYNAPPLKLPEPVAAPAVAKGSAGTVAPATGEALGKALLLMALAGGFTSSLGLRLVGALRRNL